MPISIEQVSLPEELELCNKMQAEVFHHELNLFGMQIPDKYDKFSAYVQLLNSNVPVGTFRIVLPNTSVGLPIEETGFKLNQFNKKVCEMSRLVLLKEKRRKIPFSKIISSARQVAQQHDASILVIAILPRNFSLFKRYGFSQTQKPLPDPSVKSTDAEEAVIIPMHMHL